MFDSWTINWGTQTSFQGKESNLHSLWVYLTAAGFRREKIIRKKTEQQCASYRFPRPSIFSIYPIDHGAIKTCKATGRIHGLCKKIRFKICEADPGNCLVFVDFTVDKCSKVYVGKTFQALLPVEAWLHWLHSLFNQKDKTVFVAIIIGGGNHDIIMAFFLPIRIPSLWMGWPTI